MPRFIWGEMQSQLTKGKWLQEPPSPMAEDGDRKIVENSYCRDCLGPVEYVPYKKKKQYRAFSVCRECRSWEEF